MNDSQEMVVADDSEFSNLKSYLETDSPFRENLATLTEHYNQGLLYVLRAGTLIKGYFALDKQPLFINIVIIEVLEPYRDQGLGSQMLDFIKSLIGPDRYFLSLSALTSSLDYWNKHGFQSYGLACYLLYPQTRQIQQNCTVTIRHTQSRYQWITPAVEDKVGNLVFENDYIKYHPRDDIVEILINNDVYYYGRIKYLAKTLDGVDVKMWDDPDSNGLIRAGNHIYICRELSGGRRNLQRWQRKYGYALS